ncbi:hypothetical protein PVAP13_5KG614800 [Panicum virgatum]|uniref:Neprosin PEP catalytic domain-containing protein n=1 Tax=Panicum virgatum TaxID=38727 RepID=A0A8T0SX85_PANVG|nr:hypothetical protein PVAP13_5KG614800 [Panicum virgatum]
MIVNRSNTIPQPKYKDTSQLDAVTSDVYGFPLHQDERSGMFIQINNIGDRRVSIRNSITFGWHRDGQERTGCYNLQCPGYVPEPNVPTDPGSAIDAVSDPNGVKRTIIFKVFKIDTAGEWLMHIGFDSRPYLIGRFPKSLYTSLGDKADTILREHLGCAVSIGRTDVAQGPLALDARAWHMGRWHWTYGTWPREDVSGLALTDEDLGGFVVTRTAQLAPMGSEFLPNNAKSALLSNIHLIDQNGKASRLGRDQPADMNDRNIYSVSPISVEGKFTYGGPLKGKKTTIH